MTDPENIDSFATEAVLCTVFGDGDYPPIPTYATTFTIAAARASANALAFAAGWECGGDKEVAERTADRDHGRYSRSGIPDLPARFSATPSGRLRSTRLG